MSISDPLREFYERYYYEVLYCNEEIPKEEDLYPELDQRPQSDDDSEIYNQENTQ
jgi:hypothetical protein